MPRARNHEYQFTIGVINQILAKEPSTMLLQFRPHIVTNTSLRTAEGAVAAAARYHQLTLLQDRTGSTRASGHMPPVGSIQL